MPFVNRRMTVKEQEEFKGKSLASPYDTFRTSVWTINRDQDSFLVWAMRESKEPHYEHFLLGWKQSVIPVLLRRQLAEGATIAWELKQFDSPFDARFKQEIMRTLKEALNAYGFNGSPDYQRNHYAKVVFRF